MDQKNEKKCRLFDKARAVLTRTADDYPLINLTANSSDLLALTDAAITDDCTSNSVWVWKQMPVTEYKSPGYSYLPTKYEPKSIIFNKPATIVFWKDGTKTVVKCAKGEKWNEYNAFCAALAIKIFGSNSRVQKIVRSGEDQTKKGRHEK